MLDSVPIPVHIALTPRQADHYDVELTGPPEVHLSFTGPPSRIRELRGQLQRGELCVEKTLSVPDDRQEESQYHDTIRVDADEVHPPAGVVPSVVEGKNRLSVTLRRLVERRLPVRYEHPLDDRVTNVVIEPTTVLVRGPQDILDRARSIPTQAYPLPTRLDAATGQEVISVPAVPLAQDLDGRPVKTTPAAVAVRFTLQPQQKVFEVEAPIQFLCPANFGLRPLFGDERAGKITLRLRGPAAEESPAVVAYVDLGGRKWEPGLFEEPLRLQLPKDFQLAQSPPRLVAFQLAPADQPAKPGEPPRGGP
jgi:hypothetical protein